VLRPRYFFIGLSFLGLSVFAHSSFDLDIDDDGKTEALTDGLLVIRYMFGFSGDSLTINATGTDAQRADAASIETHLVDNKSSLDVDGDGNIEALTDGLLIIRNLFGFSGDSLITGAVSESGSRQTGDSVEDYLTTIKDTDNDGVLDSVNNSPTDDATGSDGSDVSDQPDPDLTEIDGWYGTKIPPFLGDAPKSYELFDDAENLSMNGQLEGLDHEPTDAPGAGKLIFNRVYRAFKHGLEWGEQFGVFGSWLGSFGANSIEGGLWVNPKTAGPHYYPTLHLAGIGDQYHACSDVQRII